MRQIPFPISKGAYVYELDIAWCERHRLKVAVKRARNTVSFETLKVRVHQLFARPPPSLNKTNNGLFLYFFQQIGKEIRVWSDLQDENVLVLVGYLLEGDNIVPSLVSEWMERGYLDVFMKTVPRGGEESCILVSALLFQPYSSDHSRS